MPERERMPSQLPLEVRNLILERDGTRLIDAANLALHDQKLTVILGPNGAGKSLLLRLLHGIVQPSAGAIRWAGAAPHRETRLRQAMVFQKPVLLRRSVAANIDFALDLRQPGSGRTEKSHRREQLLERVGLAGRAAQAARRLSGGEQQRLALARALATEPAVLFLDEPTASLDPASVLVIEGIVRDVHREGTKIILVTHDLAQARRLAEEVVFLHHGKVLECTAAAQFFNAPTSESARSYLAGDIII